MLSPLVGVLTLRPEIVALIIILATLVFVSAILLSAMVLRLQQRRLWHETARLAIDKGQPVPLPPRVLRKDDENPTAASRRRADVRRGLALVGIGLGVYVTLLHAPEASILYVFAYVPGFVGLALLLNALLEVVISRKTDAATPPKA